MHPATKSVVLVAEGLSLAFVLFAAIPIIYAVPVARRLVIRWFESWDARSDANDRECEKLPGWPRRQRR